VSAGTGIVARRAPKTLRIPGPRSLLWLVVAPVAALALAALAMHLLGIAGGDDPAHLYKIALLRDGQSALWDNYWYGGSYGSLTYGIVYYWLAQFVPAAVLVVLSGGLLPVLFYLYMRDAWGIADRAAAWMLAAVMVVYLAWGQSPFLFALCLTMAGLVFLARGHPLLAALPCAVGVFTNPLALFAGAVFVLAALVARRESRRALLVFVAAMLPVVALRVILAAVFAAPSWDFHYPLELLGLAAVALLGAGLARVCRDPRRRALLWIFAALLVVTVPAYLLPQSPVGSNAGRFFYVFGASLLVMVARTSRLPRVVPWVAVAAVLAFQLAFPVWMLAHAEGFTATRAAFFAPALDFAGRVYDPDYRFHVVTPQMHWESYYFPAAGFPITRGWFRQADALHNAELYDKHLGAQAYIAWLRRMGVRDVFVPDAPLVATSQRESDILASSPAFTVVYRSTLWTVYELRRPQPLVLPLRGDASAEVYTLDHTTIRFSVTKPGPYLVKLTWSPYWLVARRPTDPALRGHSGRRDREWEQDAVPENGLHLYQDPYGFIVFDAPAAGLYTLRFDAARTAEAEL